MMKVLIDGKKVSLKYDGFSEFYEDVMDAHERLMTSARVGIDGNPTVDMSLFGSRQVILCHIIHTIRTYRQAHTREDLKEYYEFTHSSSAKFHSILDGAMQDYDTIIRLYDDKYQRLITAMFVDKSISDMERIMAKDELYDLLHGAREQVKTAYEAFLYGMCTDIALRFCEVGMDIFEDPKLFDCTFLSKIQEMNLAIRERHKAIKALRGSAESA
jgi:hypothetical protein